MSNSSHSPPPANGLLPQQDSTTAERIARYTILSSLTGAIFTALYESTIGRAQAIRALEARASGGNTNANATGNVMWANGLPVGSQSQSGRVAVGADVSKFYRHNTALLSASAALNSGLVAFAFFSVREHVISPSLARTRQRSGDGETEGSSRRVTWSTMRKHHVEDSALTGALLGGTFNTWKKGPKGLVPGAFTASLACTALQLVVNELDIQRIRYTLSHMTSKSPTSASTSTPSTSQNPSLPTQPSSSLNEKNGTSSNTSSSLSSSSSFTPDVTIFPPSDSNEPSNPGPSFGERILALIGITKVDNEEYIRRLKAKRDIHLARIRVLEKQIEEDRRRDESGGVGDGEGGGLGDRKGDGSDTSTAGRSK